MSSIWTVSKALTAPLDLSIKKLNQIPYTISFVIRKRQQIDGFNELPKEKRPPEKMAWDGSQDDLDEWFDKVFDTKEDNGIIISESEIEG